jgi:hypothetical protein
MKTTRKVGIWMDHSNAHIIELTADIPASKTIESMFTTEDKESTLKRSEHQMHNKEQQMQGAYYNKLIDAITGCEEVLLFGPTSAKSELANLMNNNKQFTDTKITVEATDKMTENQMNAYVKEHFLNAINVQGNK